MRTTPVRSGQGTHRRLATQVTWLKNTQLATSPDREDPSGTKPANTPRHLGRLQVRYLPRNHEAVVTCRHSVQTRELTKAQELHDEIVDHLDKLWRRKLRTELCDDRHQHRA